MDEAKKCCFCGQTMSLFFQADPKPVCTDPDAVCCPDCEDTIVIPVKELIAERTEKRLRERITYDINRKFHLKLVYEHGYYYVIDPPSCETFISSKNIQDIVAWMDSTTITIHHK